MILEVDDISWSDTGKRVDFTATAYEDGLFGRGDKLFRFKMFALGSKDKLGRYRDREDKLAEKVAEAREVWLQNVGKRYFNHSVSSEELNVRIWKSKYESYAS